ncbi:MAG: hypothetical protein PHP69_00045 [Candidatus Omnitrophica bacterium]|nr:hypothetical protein [Candidatus Omnitrophota bacterium]MDD5081505.1 hypothetical protein [Candidatus Omnitrophota bacterium]MDD5441127.1 hypothetical protein [Candidatus Omnitrophota bacterium]
MFIKKINETKDVVTYLVDFLAIFSLTVAVCVSFVLAFFISSFFLILTLMFIPVMIVVLCLFYPMYKHMLNGSLETVEDIGLGAKRVTIHKFSEKYIQVLKRNPK